MKVTVSGIGSFANRGVEALAVSTIEGLLASRPDIDVTILTNDPRTLEAYRYSYYFSDRSVRIHFDVFDRARSIYLSRLGRCGNLLKRRLLPGLIETANLVAQSDLLVFSGGDNLSSDYGSPSRWLRCLHYASRRNTPFVLHAQSIGIFREQQHVNEFLAVAQKAHLITVRERASYDYVTEELSRF
jgi:colanic acid/amylovoran biosynthesis protein